MVRYAALALVLAAGLAAFAKAKPKGPARGSAKAPAKASGPTSLHVRSIDLARRLVLIEVAGLSRAPAANLFTFTDERQRHFIAVNAHCDEPFPSGTRACELEIPPGYEKHRTVSLLLHLHGLHGRGVSAEEAEIASAWEAASANVVVAVDAGARD
jgi:hypothetical protein